MDACTSAHLTRCSGSNLDYGIRRSEPHVFLPSGRTPIYAVFSYDACQKYSIETQFVLSIFPNLNRGAQNIDYSAMLQNTSTMWETFAIPGVHSRTFLHMSQQV
ncbi:hypothetical protein QCA50_007412 [Cerrena zonata]|uniref:Uncharacterized protein n=1 Tax=Cerrena zonata TaxID=2478898 RepID=A0AAW0GIP3_9APHY